MTAEAVAVSDRHGTARLYLDHMSFGHLLFDHNNVGQLENWIEVPTLTLTEIIRKHGIERIGLLKVDCEGSEGLIFGSLPAEDLRGVDKIALEFHDNVSPLSHSAIRAQLESGGFQTAVVEGDQQPFGYLYAWRT